MELGQIVLADNPPEWADSVLADELVAMLKVDPDTGMLPVWTAQVYAAVDRDRWYLLANEDRLRGRDGRVEAYLTKLGVPLPYRGILQLYDMYTERERERGTIHGEQMRYERTVSLMRRRGRHQPITIDRAYTYWMAMRQKLGARYTDAAAERLLGPMPRRHIVDGWPVGLESLRGIPVRTRAVR